MPWQADDGSIHSTEEGARAANRTHNWMVTVMLWICLVLPVLLAKFIAWIFALFFSWGIVGKVLQTFVVSIVCPMVIMVVVWASGLGETLPDFVMVFLGIGTWIMSALWYWLWHYDTIKRMSASEFSTVIKISFAVCFYGYIVAVLIGEMGGNRGLGSFLVLAVTAVAFGFYFVRVKPYELEARAERQPDPKRKKIMLIGLSVVMALTVLTVINNAVNRSIAVSKIKKENSAIFDAGKAARRQPVTAYITKTDSAMTIDGVLTYGAMIYSRLDNRINDENRRLANMSEAVTITGEVVKTNIYWLFMVPVDYMGFSGFTQVENLSLTRPERITPAGETTTTTGTGTTAPAETTTTTAAPAAVEVIEEAAQEAAPVAEVVEEVNVE